MTFGEDAIFMDSLIKAFSTAVPLVIATVAFLIAIFAFILLNKGSFQFGSIRFDFEKRSRKGPATNK